MRPGLGFVGATVLSITVLSLTVLSLTVQCSVSTALAASESEPESDLPGVIYWARYEATAFSYRDRGQWAWLAGPEGILRLEVRRSDGRPANAQSLDDLLEQRGQGWTAILANQTDDTVNGWGAEWSHPPAGLAQAAGLVTAALARGPEVGAAPKRPWRSHWQGVKAAKHPVPPLVSTASPRDNVPVWRSNGAQRGWGRGGTQDMLVLAWKQVPDSPFQVLQVSATRSPGYLELSLVDSQKVIYAMPEAFVPLWPLSQLLSDVP